MTSWQIRQGDARAELAALPDAFVQCCVTSPPYWGLRDYGTDPLIWGGAANCDHDWCSRRYYTEKSSATAGSAEAFSDAGEANAARVKAARWKTDSTCQQCGAWLGSLGAEPTPDLYVQHLVEVCRAIRRVLKADGTFWLNLGDSYAAGGCGGGGGAYMTERGRGESAWAHRKDAKGWRKPPSGMKAKDLIGIPWMVAFALRADGWYLRSEIIWSKPNPMPESVTDRPTRAHEYIFLLSKSARYYYDADAIKNPASAALVQQVREGYSGRATKAYAMAGAQNPSAVKARIIAGKRDKQRGPGRRHAGFNDRWDAMTKAEQVALGSNARSVWTIPTRPYGGAHFATFPETLPERCIRAGSREGDTVLDPFCGSGTTGAVAVRFGRHFVGVDQNPEYVALAQQRIDGATPLFARHTGTS